MSDAQYVETRLGDVGGFDRQIPARLIRERATTAGEIIANEAAAQIAAVSVPDNAMMLHVAVRFHYVRIDEQERAT